MSTPQYAPPTITTIGSLHDMTLQFKKFGSADGTILTIEGEPDVPIGDSAVSL
jgi:hypothetical protein